MKIHSLTKWMAELTAVNKWATNLDHRPAADVVDESLFRLNNMRNEYKRDTLELAQQVNRVQDIQQKMFQQSYITKGLTKGSHVDDESTVAPNVPIQVGGPTPDTNYRMVTKRIKPDNYYDEVQFKSLGAPAKSIQNVSVIVMTEFITNEILRQSQERMEKQPNFVGGAPSTITPVNSVLFLHNIQLQDKRAVGIDMYGRAVSIPINEKLYLNGGKFVGVVGPTPLDSKSIYAVMGHKDRDNNFKYAKLVQLTTPQEQAWKGAMAVRETYQKYYELTRTKDGALGDSLTYWNWSERIAACYSDADHKQFVDAVDKSKTVIRSSLNPKLHTHRELSDVWNDYTERVDHALRSGYGNPAHPEVRSLRFAIHAHRSKELAYDEAMRKGLITDTYPKPCSLEEHMRNLSRSNFHPAVNLMSTITDAQEALKLMPGYEDTAVKYNKAVCIPVRSMLMNMSAATANQKVEHVWQDVMDLVDDRKPDITAVLETINAKQATREGTTLASQELHTTFMQLQSACQSPLHFRSSTKKLWSTAMSLWKKVAQTNGIPVNPLDTTPAVDPGIPGP